MADHKAKSGELFAVGSVQTIVAGNSAYQNNLLIKFNNSTKTFIIDQSLPNRFQNIRDLIISTYGSPNATSIDVEISGQATQEGYDSIVSASVKL
jgi:hypothetical protein